MLNGGAKLNLFKGIVGGSGSTEEYVERALNRTKLDVFKGIEALTLLYGYVA